MLRKSMRWCNDAWGFPARTPSKDGVGGCVEVIVVVQVRRKLREP